MVEDLLRGFVPGFRPGQIDFATLDKLSAEFVSNALLRRPGDAVWGIRLRERSLHVGSPREFQLQDDPQMALRLHNYTGLLYEKIYRNRAMAAGLATVLPVVLYNGAVVARRSRWAI